MFKVKYNLNGFIERYQMRLAAQKLSQVYGVDYIETFSPTIRRESLRIFLAITAILGIIFIQIDVFGAYLQSAFSQNKQPIYMKIPQWYIVRKSLVYKILKSLYGLKQAGRLWNKTITKFFRKIGFIPTNVDSYISLLKEKENSLL